MKKVFFIAILCMVGLISGNAAENRWHVYGGANLSHNTQELYPGLSYGWGAGSFLGGGYEINFSKYVSLSPQLEINYINNGAWTKNNFYDFYGNHYDWRGMWNISIPIVFNVRVPLSDKVGLRIGAGPYVQETFVLREYAYQTSNMVTNTTENFMKRFNFGVLGEAAVETGQHLGYFFRTQYVFLEETWSRNTLTLSLGVRYTF